jgi:hypothetical protein
MATVKDIRVGDYCTRVYTELSGMKAKLLNFVQEIEAMRGPEKEMLASQIPHFQYIVDTIDWKLEILSRVCPFEWEGPVGVEKHASVQVLEVPAEGAEGYLGG